MEAESEVTIVAPASTMVLISVQVCSGPKAIHDWSLVPVSEDSTLLAVFEALGSGQIESPDGWRLPDEYMLTYQ